MTSEERFERMERILDRVAATQLQLDSAFATLADEQIKMQLNIQLC